MNYFLIQNGRIAYMANFHDTVPFHPEGGERQGHPEGGERQSHPDGG
jgi:hypothetical protein